MNMREQAIRARGHVTIRQECSICRARFYAEYTAAEFFSDLTPLQRETRTVVGPCPGCEAEAANPQNLNCFV